MCLHALPALQWIQFRGGNTPEREKIRLVNKSCDNGEYRCFLSNSESFNICKIGFEHLTIE